ncbi:FAD-dependent oxidoreductase [Acrocarpospora phusangensis]|uniref:FAD-dependent oxidoreductase n=1 Tax=Acrocarpospora phusangensis TaxID=1070424 RepID=A0A919ULE2_9ACTN|nr:FAD-dependent monooxygenase [Acrocarpospora phusangensis]GIH25894.1 FAD-dependent oxidoreductase [Acrocarpospora phusangensis]
MRILISGASVAGPVLAYWLSRYGFDVTLVERAPALRKAGGHAVDLFRPATRIAGKMGVLAELEARKTGTELLSLRREGSERTHRLRVGKLITTFSDQHIEIMRDDLSEVFYDATRDRAEYLFGDSIAALREHPGGVEVTFENGPAREFDLVIGADGLHSNVRRLVFGPESAFTTWIGAYLAVMSMPNYLGLRGRVEGVVGVNRMAAVYGDTRMDDARGLFMFRPERELDYHHRDAARQKDLLREHLDGLGWEVPRLMEMLDTAPTFYFDSVTQLRMPTWSRGRVSLVGDAGYSPGPAVGGSTSIAIVGAYVLAGELAEAGGDHLRAFAAYERELGDYVRRSRRFAVGAAKRLIPGSSRALTGMVAGIRIIDRLPAPVARAASRLGGGVLRLHDEVPVRDYQSVATRR